MVRDSVQLETAVNTITHEYLLEFTSEYGISEMLRPELPGPGDMIVDFPEGKVDECVFPPAVEWRTNASKDGMPKSGTYSVEAVRVLDTHRTPIQKQPEALLCLVDISRRYYLGDDVYLTFHYDDDRGGGGSIQLNTCSQSNKVKARSRPRAPHELPLLTLTASRVIEMDEPAATTDLSGIPSAIEKSPLDFADEAEASGQETAAPEVPPPEEVPITTVPGGNQAAPVAVEPPTVQESRKRGREGIDANAPPKSLRRDHADLQPSCSSCGGKSLAAMQLCLASNIFVYEGVPADVSDPDPLAFADAPSPHPADVIRSSQGVAAVGDPGSKNVSSPTEVGSLGGSPRTKNPSSGVRNKDLEALLETEADMKRVAEEKSVGLSQELERMRAQFSELQERQQDQMVKQRCAEMDVRLDAMSIDFDEELYPHMLTAIAGRRWVIGHGLRLATMKSLQSLKDLKLPLLDQLEGLKDAPMDVIMASLYLEDDTGDDAPQFIRDLRSSSSQLAIPVYPEVGDPQNPWVCTEEIKLVDAIAANISRAEQKKRSRIGLALILVDAATQTDLDA
nr:hypothetical protein [Tanacetum cinerariifolium]